MTVAGEPPGPGRGSAFRACAPGSTGLDPWTVSPQPFLHSVLNPSFGETLWGGAPPYPCPLLTHSLPLTRLPVPWPCTPAPPGGPPQLFCLPLPAQCLISTCPDRHGFPAHLLSAGLWQQVCYPPAFWQKPCPSSWVSSGSRPSLALSLVAPHPFSQDTFLPGRSTAQAHVDGCGLPTMACLLACSSCVSAHDPLSQVLESVPALLPACPLSFSPTGPVCVCVCVCP